MRNCQPRCRPCCPSKGQGGGGGCVETIVHPTVHCRSEHHHHQRVRNIVPVVFHQTHHHHKHHEYEVRRRHTQDHNHHEHGRRNEDWCRVGKGSGGCKGQSRMSEDQFPEQCHGQGMQEAGCEFDEQMFS